MLRGPRPRAGAEGLAGALTRLREELAKFRRGEPTDLHRGDPRTTIADAEIAATQVFVTALATALKPLEEVKGRQSFVALAKLHAEVLAALSDDGAGTTAAFAGQDGETLADVFEDIAEQRPSDDLAIGVGDYADLFETAIAPEVCRRTGAPGERVRILGPLEARLVTVDRVVLGGLVEGVWPPDARSDPWLSRPMRHDLGLDLPERRIGLSAHDFAQLARHARRDPHARREGRRRADGRVALRAAARRGRGRNTGRTCSRAAKSTPPGRARSTGPRPSSRWRGRARGRRSTRGRSVSA